MELELELELWRYSGGNDATLGMLMAQRRLTWEMLCFTCEDEHRALKVMGETRIPAFRYRLELRTEGGMHERYSARFGKWHKGMIWIRGVPNFTFAYLHIGNDEGDTDGCPLVGTYRNEVSRTVGQSTTAYKAIYPEICEAIRGEGARLTIRDLDRAMLPAPPNFPG